MATFITNKNIGEFINIDVQTSTGYWKYNHNGTDSGVFNQGDGSQSVEVLDANGEFTIISCTSGGTVSGDITRLDLQSNGLTSFDGTGLSGLTNLNLFNNELTSFNGTDLTSLTYLNLAGNGLTSFNGTDLSSLTELSLGSIRDKDGSILASNNLTLFDGTGLSSLTTLNLQDNPLTTFIGGDMGLITTLDFRTVGLGGWNITTLETFNGTGLTGLARLNLTNNQIVSLDVTPMTSLSTLELDNNPITPQNWDSILSGLVDLGNEDGDLSVGTAQRTAASSVDYTELVDTLMWTVQGTFEVYTPPTFITNKNIGEFINIDIETSEGFWKYFHDGVWSEVYDSGTYNGYYEIEVNAEDGEFTLTSCDDEGTISGDITYLDLNNNGLTSFDGTGLSGLTQLYLGNNQLTSFDGTGLSGLTKLYLAGNLLTGLDVSSMTSLTNLILNEKGDTNPLTSAANDSILNQLEANGLENGNFNTINWRTDAGTADFNTLISRGWTIKGANLKPTFKLTPSGTFQITVDTTSGFWKYFHDGAWSEVFDTGNYAGGVEIITTAGDGEFILESCDDEGNKDGDIIEISCKDSLISEFYGDQLGTLVILDLSGNQLESLDVSPMTSLTQLSTENNLLTASSNDSILNGLESNGLTNGVFNTTGGRTSAGTADYNTLISRGWTIEGVSIPQWYRFKALGTQWTGVSGKPNNIIKEVQGTGSEIYISGGYSYVDFLTADVPGTITFDDGGGNTIEATPVQVTLQEFSSSGSFTAGVGFDAGGGNSIGYGNTTDFGNWGTLNSGTLPAIPSRYEGDVPAGSVVFSDLSTAENSFCLITAPILLSLTVNNNSINLTDVIGSENGTSIEAFGFGENDEVTFSMTWGELVETTPPSTGRKLRVRGISQQN